MTKNLTPVQHFYLLCLSFLCLTALLLAPSLTIADSSITFTEKEREWIKNNPTVTLGFDSNYAPIEMIDGKKHTGMSSEYLRIIERETGLEFESYSEPFWSNIYQQAVDGKLDVLSSTQKTKAREAHFLFTQPYTSLKAAIITARHKYNDPLTLTDLHGAKMAVVRGYFWINLLETEHPDIELVIVDSIEKGLISVAFGSVDAFLGAMPTITNYTSENAISNLQISGYSDYSIALSFAVRKDKPELYQIIEKVLNSISEKEHNRLYNKWVKVDKQLEYYMYRSTPFRVVAAILFFAILSLLGFIFWNRTLTKKVENRTNQLAELNNTLEERVALRTQELEESNKELESIRQKLKSQVNIDVLTGIANRRKLEDRLAQFYREDEYLDAPYSILMIDIDYFKKYNDTYGHQQGDIALKRVAAELSKDLRRNGELVARYGGEEFSIFLANTDKAKAIEIAQAKLIAIQAMKLEHKGSEISDYVTVSIGIQCVEKGVQMTRKQLIERADQALYKAKESGRNQVMLFDENWGD